VLTKAKCYKYLLDWGKGSWEEALKSKDPMFTYNNSKIFAERAAWNFAREHPLLDLATSQYLHPCMRAVPDRLN
jgi:hypothetical protein